MKRRIAALLVCAMVAIGLCGCAAVSHTAETVMTPTTAAPPSVDVPMVLLESGHAYTCLSEKQRDNYDVVVQMLYDKRGQDSKVNNEAGLDVGLPHALTTAQEAEELFMAVYDDHPEFFYLDYRYGYVPRGSFIIALRFYYLWDATERAAKATELEAAVQPLLADARGQHEAAAERLFHDALTARGTYNEAAAKQDTEEETRMLASTPYAALCTGDPICGGYARAFQLLLRRVGIMAAPVRNDEHMWSMVWIDGDAYHTDVTWDDPVGDTARHEYFNLTDAEIRATREYPAQLFALPEAQSTEHNYHVANAWYFTDARDGLLGDVIRAQIESSKDTVELKFDPAVFEEALSYLLDEEAYFQAVYALDDDALRDAWYSNVAYDIDSDIGTIRLRPNN